MENELVKDHENEKDNGNSRAWSKFWKAGLARLTPVEL